VLLLLLLLVMQHLAAMPQVSSLYAVADMLLDISKLFLLILAPLQGTVLLQPLCVAWPVLLKAFIPLLHSESPCSYLLVACLVVYTLKNIILLR